MTFLIDWIKYLIGLADPENLRALVNLSGPWWVSYLILWAIIFSETGLLVGFFLPGDSLLFAAGLLASQEVFNVGLLIAALSRGRGGRRRRQLLSRTANGRARLRARSTAIRQAQPPDGGQGVLRAARRQGDHSGAVRAAGAHVHAVRGRRGPHELRALRRLQHRRRHRLDRVDVAVRLLARPDSLDSRSLRGGRDRDRAGQRDADRHGVLRALAGSRDDRAQPRAAAPAANDANDR